MARSAVKAITRTITYIETHLNEKLDLDTVAGAVHYSKYHLHRMFTATAGMTVHDYIRRRQMTEAARMLVFSETPIMEAALAAGYESRQAFADAFKAMYKQTPMEYRANGVFYPLLLEVTLNNCPSGSDAVTGNITFAACGDIPAWMELAALTVYDFPCFQEAEHLEKLKGYIEERQALMMWDGELAVGAMAFTDHGGSIDFLGVHPQYRRQGITKAFLDYITENVFPGRTVTITTFREGDRADTGQRAEYKRLGFAEAELLTEFGYPTQRMVLMPGRGGDADE